MKSLYKRSPKLIIGALLFIFLLLISFLLPLILKGDPYSMKVTQRLKPPSQQFIMGTDEFGRNLLIRILYGGRISLGIGISVTILSLTLGTIIGLYSSYYSFLDKIFMRLTDGIMAIPGILLAIALMSAFGSSAKNVIITLTIVYFPQVARMVRANSFSVKKELFIRGILSIGARTSRIIWIHIFPNILPQLLEQAIYVFAGTIISEASLSFLGAGIPSPEPSWGTIIQGGKTAVFKAPWVVFSPSIFILLTVLSLNIAGEGLKELIDPHNKIKISKNKKKSELNKAVLALNRMKSEV